MLNLRFLNEYFVVNISNKQELKTFTRLNGFNSSYSLVQPSVSQEGQNVIHVDVLEQLAQIIYVEKSFSYETESSTF